LVSLLVASQLAIGLGHHGKRTDAAGTGLGQRDYVRRTRQLFMGKLMDDYNEKNEGAREALTSVARMARISVRSRSLRRSVAGRLPLNHAV
jgi:hypothetical protein